MENLDIVIAELEVGRISVGYGKGELVFFVKTGMTVEECASFLQEIKSQDISFRSILRMPVVSVLTYGSWQAKREKTPENDIFAGLTGVALVQQKFVAFAQRYYPHCRITADRKTELMSVEMCAGYGPVSEKLAMLLSKANEIIATITNGSNEEKL